MIVDQEDLVHSEAENMVSCVSDQKVIRNNIKGVQHRHFVY